MVWRSPIGTVCMYVYPHCCGNVRVVALTVRGIDVEYILFSCCLLHDPLYWTGSTHSRSRSRECPFRAPSVHIHAPLLSPLPLPSALFMLFVPVCEPWQDVLTCRLKEGEPLVAQGSPLGYITENLTSQAWRMYVFKILQDPLWYLI